MNATKFNLLSSSEKWAKWKEQNGQWACPGCGIILDDGPNRAYPSYGCTVNCGNCDQELTRRTGGGQFDRFNWKLVK